MSLNYELSYWEYNSFLADLDVAVIGGGLVGLQTALLLKEHRPALRIAVLERGPLPIGASTRNAGFACFGSMTELLDDLRRMPEDEVWATVERRYRGLERLRERFPAAAIDFQYLGGYELFGAEDEAVFEACRAHRESFNRRLQPLTGETETFRLANDKRRSLGLQGVRHLLLNVAEGQLDTGALMRLILQRIHAAGILLLAGTSVESFTEAGDYVELQTQWGWPVRARRALLATNAFAPQLAPDLDVQPARNQVMITPPLEGLRLRGCFHYHEGYVYFRNVGRRILIGGGRHLDLAGERTTAFGEHPRITAYLHELLAGWLGRPPAEVPIERRWSGIIGQGSRKAPIIRPLTDRVVAAVRLAGMGVALSSLLAAEAAEMLLGERVK